MVQGPRPVTTPLPDPAVALQQTLAEQRLRADLEGGA